MARKKHLNGSSQSTPSGGAAGSPSRSIPSWGSPSRERPTSPSSTSRPTSSPSGVSTSSPTSWPLRAPAKRPTAASWPCSTSGDPSSSLPPSPSSALTPCSSAKPPTGRYLAGTRVGLGHRGTRLLILYSPEEMPQNSSQAARYLRAADPA